MDGGKLAFALFLSVFRNLFFARILISASEVLHP